MNDKGVRDSDTSLTADQKPRYESTDVIAMVIEIVFGLFGILGMGWIYVGNFSTGIVLFIGWLIVVLIATLSPTIITTFTLGLGFITYCCLCVLPPMSIAVAAISGIRLRDYVRNTGAKGNVLYLILAAIIGLILVCLAVVVPLFLLGGLAALGSIEY